MAAEWIHHRLGTTVTSFELEGLSSNTEYNFTVAAITQNGIGAFAVGVLGTTDGSSGPAAPSAVTVVAPMDTFVDLGWTPDASDTSAVKWAVQFRPTQRWTAQGAAVSTGGMYGLDLTGEWYDSSSQSYVLIGPTKDGYKGILLTQDPSVSDLEVGDVLFYTTRTKTIPGTSYGIQWMTASTKQAVGAHRLVVAEDTLSIHVGTSSVGGAAVSMLSRAGTVGHGASSGIAGLPTAKAGFDWDSLPAPLANLKPSGSDTSLRNCAVYRQTTSSAAQANKPASLVVDNSLSDSSFCSDASVVSPHLEVDLEVATPISIVTVAYKNITSLPLSFRAFLQLNSALILIFMLLTLIPEISSALKR